MENTGKKGPERKFRAGPISATIWRNQGEKGSYATIQLERSYKDGANWKSTASLRVNDLPKAVLVLNKAYDYLLTESKEEQKEEMIAIEEIM